MTVDQNDLNIATWMNPIEKIEVVATAKRDVSHGIKTREPSRSSGIDV